MLKANLVPSPFCVAYTKCVATLWHDRIYLFVHESRARVKWFSKPHMYALRTFFFFVKGEFKAIQDYSCYAPISVKPEGGGGGGRA